MTTQYTPNFQLAMPDFRAGPWHDLVNNDFAKIDALLYGAMSQANVAPWKNATTYTPGVTVIDNSDASVWVCAVGHASAPLPTTFLSDRTTHPTYWARLLTGFAPRGEWKQNTQYFPYDLTYDSARGIMALCQTIHISTATGSILDDSSHWAFLLNMTDVGTVIASAVTYSNTASGLTATNVQNAIDQVQTEIVSLNNVNVTQGSQITNLTSVNSTQDTNISNLTTRMTAAENVNTTQNTRLSALEAASGPVPAGSTMLFWQAAAPTGWTKLVAHNDKTIRVVSGSGGVAGGVTPFSTIHGSNCNRIQLHSGLPAHSHNVVGLRLVILSGSFTFTRLGGSQTFPGNLDGFYGVTDTQGSGSAHNHSISMNIQYIDVILASKN